MRLGTLATALFLTASAHADIDPVSGIDFVTVGAPGNAPWQGNGTPGDRAIGRGGVGYEYKIGKFEVTSAQWVDFFNAAYDRPAGDTIPHLIPPDCWGGISTTPTHIENPNARRWTTTPQSAMLPTGDISWRMAAIYCNWLHNGKATNREAFLNGAYDVSTFGYQGTVFTDQLTHHPDAHYWIPTWDEWLKAAHYDPVKQNSDGSLGGWWLYPHRSDVAPVYGPPNVFVNGVLSQANAGWDQLDYPGFNPFSVQLGAYAQVTSPWGLLDVAGATREWTEETVFVNGVFPADRYFDGTAWDFSTGTVDRINSVGGDFPSLAVYDLGFRIATSVPAPGISALAVSLFALAAHRRRSSG
ncbi:MAG: SUMF1/EgtB/PvdO family nonheme iron enzyme [Phycisphaerales bacterium]